MKTKMPVRWHRARAHKALPIREYVKIWRIACREFVDLSREKISPPAVKKLLTPKREKHTVSDVNALYFN
jgi:hypothetical protein